MPLPNLGKSQPGKSKETDLVLRPSQKRSPRFELLENRSLLSVTFNPTVSASADVYNRGSSTPLMQDSSGSNPAITLITYQANGGSTTADGDGSAVIDGNTLTIDVESDTEISNPPPNDIVTEGRSDIGGTITLSTPSILNFDYTSTDTGMVGSTTVKIAYAGGQSFAFVGGNNQTLNTTTTLPTGTYYIFATGISDSLSVGNQVYEAAATANFHLVIAETPVKAATTTTLTATPSPANYGQAVILTATVPPASSGVSAPTGIVTFMDRAIVIGSGTLNVSGVATLMVSDLPTGTDPITAVYAGDDNNEGSTSAPVSQVIDPITTTTALVSAPVPSRYGQAVTFTATVTPSSSASPPPTGTVVFMAGTVTIGSGSLNATGTASFATSLLSVGTDRITAVYAGDGNYLGSTSTPLSQLVTQADTTTTLVSTPNPADYGQAVSFTATVSPDEAGKMSPTGGVTFMDGLIEIGTSTLDANGQATFSTSTLTSGDHVITAEYDGDDNYDGSSGSLPQTVKNSALLSINSATITSDALSVYVSYAISGSDLSAPGILDFSWATGPNLADTITTDTTPVMVSTETKANSVDYSASVLITDFGQKPEKAAYVIVVADSAEVDPDHSFTAVKVPLPDIRVIDAKTTSATQVSFDFSVAGNPGTFLVGVYRSANSTFDASATLLGEGNFGASPNSSSSGTINLAAPLANNLNEPYLIVVADPPETGYPNGLIAESDKNNNVASIILPDIDVLDAEQNSSTVVNFNFSVIGNPGAFIAGLYRSATPTFDQTATLLAGGFFGTGPNSTGTGSITLLTPLFYDPAQPYLIVVADPPETGYSNGLIAESDKSDNDATITLPHRDIIMGKVTTPDSKSVTADYSIETTGITQDLMFNVYRSASLNYSPDDLIATDTIYASDQNNLTVGRHEITLGVGNSLPPDTSKPYVIVVANPDLSVYEDNYYDNTSYFQIHELGAIAHGFILPEFSDPFNNGETPAWETTMAASLESVDHFDSVIPFNWVLASSADVPGRAVAAGQHLATQIVDAANGLMANHDGDVVDLDLIGHSRGAVVISQALIDLERDDPTFTNSSYIQMTLIDPHPATNFLKAPLKSGYATSYLKVVEDFQEVANDPQVVIPSDVQNIQLFYQNTPYDKFPLNSSEYYVNLWGEGSISYDGGITAGAIINYSTAIPIVVSLTSMFYSGIGVIGHSETHDFYQTNFVNQNKALL